MKTVTDTEKFSASGLTCLVQKNGKTVFESRERGIAPLIALIESGIDTRGAVCFDKIVGKAAALLYSYMQVQCVHAEVLSKTGLEIFEKYGIINTYLTLTDVIINRKGDGECPMEQTVKGINNPPDALIALKNKIEEHL